MRDTVVPQVDSKMGEEGSRYLQEIPPFKHGDIVLACFWFLFFFIFICSQGNENAAEKLQRKHPPRVDEVVFSKAWHFEKSFIPLRQAREGHGDYDAGQFLQHLSIRTSHVQWKNT